MTGIKNNYAHFYWEKAVISRVLENWPIRSFLIYFVPHLKFVQSDHFLIGRCPMHPGHGGSYFTADLLNNRWRCRVCHSSGDVILLYSRLYLMSYVSAAQALDKYNLKVGL